MRLGLPTRILGRRGLRAYDTRRPQSAPHLSVSLAHLHDVFAYLASINTCFYRLASDLAPYSTHPTLTQFHNQIEACATELAAVGLAARRQGLRLSMHAPLHVHLAAQAEATVQRSCAELELLTALLEGMQLGPDAVIVVHVGGVGETGGGGFDGVLRRWVARFERLPVHVQRRLVLEHEDDGASLGMALRIHAETGIPLVFDYLHFRLNNPERWSLPEALAVALATWPCHRTPKLHFSSPRTELRAVERDDPQTGRRRWMLSPPRPGHHADFLNPWEFAEFVQAAGHMRDFDVMLEAKAADIALLRLHQDLQRYVPEIASWLAAPPQQALVLE